MNSLGVRWAAGALTSCQKSYWEVKKPGTHRVVLDLAFAGYGLSARLVERGGELLGVAAPNARFDPVPGARIAVLPLGLAVQKLQKAGARFDTIVAEVQGGDQTPAVGLWASPPTLAHGGRRILGAVPAQEKTVGKVDLSTAVWQATFALLSDRGEAQLRLPFDGSGSRTSGRFGGFCVSSSPGSGYTDFLVLGERKADFTRGQRETFVNTLMT